MMRVNLIPAHRLETRRRRRRLWQWGAVVSVYLLVLAGAYGVCRTLWQADCAGVARDLEQSKFDIARAEKAMAQLRPKLAEAQATLEVNRAVAQQPDWSVLLALLSDLRPNDVVLDLCQLQTAAAAVARPAKPGPSPAPGAAKPGEERERVLLRLSGFGKSQGTVSDFVLRLEQTGLFERVALLKTSREPFLAGEAMAFAVECTFKGTRRVAR